MYVYMFGIARLLRLAMRRGLLYTNNAAPPGSLDRNTEAVNADDQLLEDQPSCSICFEDFFSNNNKEKEKIIVVKTKKCIHLYHKQCLQGWLQVNRSCPLCREDLGV